MAWFVMNNKTFLFTKLFADVDALKCYVCSETGDQAIKLRTRRTVVVSWIAVIGKRSKQLASRQWIHSVPLKAPAKAWRIFVTKLTAAKTPPAVTLTTVTEAQRFTSACSWWSFAVLLALCLSNSKETEKRFCNELRLAYVNETCTIN